MQPVPDSEIVGSAELRKREQESSPISESLEQQATFDLEPVDDFYVMLAVTETWCIMLRTTDNYY